MSTVGAVGQVKVWQRQPYATRMHVSTAGSSISWAAILSTYDPWNSSGPWGYYCG
jgi:hypothetical protein